MQRLSLKTEKIKRTKYQRNINNQRSDSCYLSVWSISPTTTSLIISLDPANSSSTSAELGLCFVDLIWFSEPIVDAAIYARTYSSRWRSKSLVQPLLPPPPSSSASGFIRSATRVFPLNHGGQKSIPAEQICTDDPGNFLCIYMFVKHWSI